MNRSDKLTLVTGASGFLGNNLVRHLLESGHRVRALIHNSRESLADLDVERVDGDVLSAESINAAVDGVDLVFHLAGIVSIESGAENNSRMREVNIVGTRNVAEACLRGGVRRMVHFSSVHALAYCPSGTPANESCQAASDRRYHRDYDLSKAEGERQVVRAVERGLDAVIINPAGVLGPFDFNPSPSGEMLMQLADRKMPGLVRSGYHWVDARDVARGAVAAAQRGKTGERYILSSEFGSFAQIARWVSELTGARAPVVNVPVWLARAAAPLAARFSRMAGQRPLFTPETIKVVAFQHNIRTDKARRELGFTPRPVEATVKDSLQWMLNHRQQNETDS